MVRNSPLDFDTDSNGYLDGWIGVYGVDDSENAILYVENLDDSDDYWDG